MQRLRVICINLWKVFTTPELCVLYTWFAVTMIFGKMFFDVLEHGYGSGEFLLGYLFIAYLICSCLTHGIMHARGWLSSLPSQRELLKQWKETLDLLKETVKLKEQK